MLGTNKPDMWSCKRAAGIYPVAMCLWLIDSAASMGRSKDAPRVQTPPCCDDSMQLRKQQTKQACIQRATTPRVNPRPCSQDSWESSEDSAHASCIAASLKGHPTAQHATARAASRRRRCLTSGFKGNSALCIRVQTKQWGW